MHNHTCSESQKKNTKSVACDDSKSKVCSGRGKSYCLVHRRYFETSWCPDCSRSKFF
ncbi:hypothetical protein BJV82DRAFT_503529 [Fennellomyces sp. T-0311]|nr:hypothetical protein BJV82DRAFT_503529 [Fennellomyces sp. T-0311]